jgi:transposase
MIFSEISEMVSQSYVSRMLKRNGITYKKATKHFQEQKLSNVVAFINQIPQEACGSWMALDEASFTLNLCPLYGYSRKGCRCTISRPGSRGKRFSLLLCIDSNGTICHELYHGGVNSIMFSEFLKKLPNNRTLVLDNASIHHATRSLNIQRMLSIKDVANQKNIRLQYLPPYTPQLNPVELAFNVIRSKIRKSSVRSVEQLRIVIEEELNHINFLGFFQHCWASDSVLDSI